MPRNGKEERRMCLLLAGGAHIIKTLSLHKRAAVELKSLNGQDIKECNIRGRNAAAEH